MLINKIILDGVFNENHTSEDRPLDNSFKKKTQIKDNLEEEEKNNFSSKNEDLLNLIMFSKSKITVEQVLSGVQAISLSYNVSKECRHAIMAFIILLAGPEYSKLNISKYFEDKIFNPPETTKQYIYFCKNCKKKISESLTRKEVNLKKKLQCNTCREVYDLLTTRDFFVKVDLEYQLEKLLKNEETQKILLSNAVNNRRKIAEESDYIKDIFDSERYKNSLFFKDKSETDVVLTMNFSCDGVEIFRSIKNSLQPCTGIINENCDKLRFKEVLVMGMWWPNSEPGPELVNVYIKTVFVSQIIPLMQKGKKWTFHDGITRTVYVLPFACPVDTVFRPVISNRISFSGYFGCNWCYIKGFRYQGAIRYSETEDKPLRTHDKYLLDLKAAENNRDKTVEHIFGVKGRSALNDLPFFDGIWGLPQDDLHFNCIGCMKQLWNEWSKPYGKLSNKQKKIVDGYMMSIRPIKEMQRVQRTMSDKSKWKALEWKWFLFYYGLIVLEDILDDKLLESFALYVKSSYLLCSTHIEKSELEECDVDILRFVCDCERFYGLQFMTSNIHSARHLVECVKKNGPLPFYSTFPFESKYSDFKNSVNGTAGVVDQITDKVLQSNKFEVELNVMDKSTPIGTFCNEIYCKRKFISNYIQTAENAILTQTSENVTNNVYHRCIYKGTVLHSTFNTRVKKTDNTVIQLENGKIFRISKFTCSDNKCYIEGNQLMCKPMKIGSVIINHILKVEKQSQALKKMRITEMKQKLLFVELNKFRRYVCIPPNNLKIS